LLLSILLISLKVSAQETEKLNNAWEKYFDLQFDSCAYYIDSAMDFNSRYLYHLLQATKVFMKDDLTFYKTNKHLEDNLLDELAQLKFKEEESNFLKSEIKLQWAIIKLKNGDEFSAFWNLKQAHSLAKANYKAHPEFISSYKTLGLLNVLFGILPDKYHWILSLFGIDGDISKGMDLLTKAEQNINFLSMEVTLTKALLYSYLLNSPKKGAAHMGLKYKKTSPLLVVYAYALVLMKNAESEKALSVVREYDAKGSSFELLPQMYYVLGEIYLQKGLPDTALTYYHQFLITHREQNLVKDTNYKIGLCHLLTDREDSVKKYFDISRNISRAKNEADKNANYMLNLHFDINKELIKLRYATDGGYFDNALMIRNNIDTMKFNTHDQCEYAYRSARLFHKTGKIERAIYYYMQTIKRQEKNHWYFAPNSALQLGLLYDKKGNEEQAVYYLKQVNDYSSYNYENSIKQKAKTALKAMD